MKAHNILIALLSIATIGIAANLFFTISNFNEQKDVQLALSKFSTAELTEVNKDTDVTSEVSDSSPIPDDFMFFCPPSGDTVQSAVRDFDQELYVELYLGCTDSNVSLSNRLFLKRVDGRFERALEYSFSNHALTWQFEDMNEQKLVPIANIPWEEIDGFGGDGNSVEVYDITLNGKKLGLLKQPISYRDGGLGGFQEASFELIDVTKGLLTWNGIVYEVSFESGTVKVVE